MDRPTESGILLPQEESKIDISKERKTDGVNRLSNVKKTLAVDDDLETRSGPPKNGYARKDGNGLNRTSRSWA